MFKQLAKLANWKVILPLTALYLLFAAYLFPKYAAEMQSIAGKEIAILDIQTSYDADIVNTLFTDLKEEGRVVYHFVTSKVDMIYPLVYGCWMILLLVMTWKGLVKRHTPIPFLCFLPLGIVLFDYLENFNTLKMLSLFPEISTDLVSRGSLFTSTKWGFAAASFLFLGIGLVVRLVQRFKK